MEDLTNLKKTWLNGINLKLCKLNFCIKPTKRNNYCLRMEKENMENWMKECGGYFFLFDGESEGNPWELGARGVLTNPNEQVKERYS